MRCSCGGFVGVTNTRTARTKPWYTVRRRCCDGCGKLVWSVESEVPEADGRNWLKRAEAGRQKR